MPQGGGLRNPVVGAMMMDAMLGRAIGNYVITGELVGGMTREEVAAALGLTVATVKRDLRLAEAWLRRDLQSGG